MIAGLANAASRDVQYGPQPSWVLPAPKPTDTAIPQGAPLRVIYSDSQTHLGTDVDETYTAYRIKLLAPESLTLGNIALAWSPSTDDVFIHELKIIRGDQVIDVLKTNKFQIIQRENSLEYSVLDGNLTATLQTPGLQVGDELEFAATIRRRDSVFAGRSHGLQQLPPVGALGAFRARVVWQNAKDVHWRATPDLGKIVVDEHDGQHDLMEELRDPDSVVIAEGAPQRFNLRRLIEYSEFSSWADVSSRLLPLFDKAGMLAPNSPLRLEAAKIASATNDPAARAEAALRLVQDQVRYVYIGLDEGAYRPASADQTWARRFGDCKAKTVLLISLLRELGIPSEAVLVNSKGGDGTDQFLPTPAVFDHVVVRATIAGKAYWLDGTRLGDHRLEGLPPPEFRWALPLRPGEVKLEAVPVEAPTLPMFSTVLAIDASAGLDVPAQVKIEDVFRDEAAFDLRAKLTILSAADANRALKTYWQGQYDWVEPTTTSWRFDDFQNALILTMSGEGKPDWEGSNTDGRTLQIDGAGFTPPNPLHRPSEEDQTAPWTNEFPQFKRWTTLIRLPADANTWRWDYTDKPVHEQLGGVSYWREAQLSSGLFMSTMSRRTLLPEITAAQAKDLNDGLPSFDNKISQVFQVSAHAGPSEGHPNAAFDELFSSDAKALFYAAQQAEKAGLLDSAVDRLDEALRYEPESATLWRERAEVLHRLSRHEESVRDFEEAGRINPLDPWTQRDKAEELRLVGRTDDFTLAMTTEPAATAPAPKAAAALAPNGVKNEDFLVMPDNDQMQMNYPPATLAAHLGGRATVRCVVTSEGSLGDCKILSETPSDRGFGQATLAVTRYWKIRLVRLDGTPTEGANFQRTVVWMPPPQFPPFYSSVPSALHQPAEPDAPKQK
jgi:TonB family protein